jgi:hypothetical protein
MNSGKPRRSRKTTEPGRRRSSSTRPTATVWPTSTSAMRDLEIRGVGNLLGTQQSGHIATVGYDLYCRLLEQAVRGLKALPPAEPPPVRSTPTRSPIPTNSSPACGRSSPWLPLPPAKACDAFRPLHLPLGEGRGEGARSHEQPRSHDTSRRERRSSSHGSPKTSRSRAPLVAATSASAPSSSTRRRSGRSSRMVANRSSRHRSRRRDARRPVRPSSCRCMTTAKRSRRHPTTCR